jgi:diguanylate cyclase (GGDEF)-like protein
VPGTAYVGKPAAAGHSGRTPVPVVLTWAPVAAVSQPGGALVPPIFTRLPAVLTALLTLVLWILALGAAVRLVGGRRVSDLLRTWRMSPVQRRVAVHHGIRPAELATLSEEALRRLQEEAAVDPLTGTLSRKAGIAALNRAVAVAERYAGSLCVAMVGLDGLNDIGDEQDRAAADQYLRGVATCLRQRLRFEDLIVRYTAGEYVCVLVQAPPEQAAKVMDEIQQSARAKGWKFTHGLTCYQAGDHTVDLITRATQEMQKRRPGETLASV